MAFDSSQPFEVLDEEPAVAPRFDPTQPFTYEPAAGAERTALAERAPLTQAAPSTTQGGTVGGGLTPASSQPGALDSLLATTGESLPSGRDLAAVVPTALRVGGPVAGAALAPFTGTASVPVGMGLAVLGGLLAEPAAQAVERATGQREDFSAAEGAVNVAFAPLAAAGLPFANRALPTLGQRALQVGARGLEGAAISAGQGSALRAARGEEQSLGATLTDAAVGGAFSAVLGTAFDELVRARRLDTAFTAARQAGFNGQSVDDLRGWWEAQRAARARNVTPNAAPAPAPGANATNATPPRPAGAASPAPAPAAGPLATRAPRIDVEIVPAEAPVPRDVARLAGGLRAAELPAPAAPMALPTSARPALPAPSASVDPVTGSPALDNPSSDTPAPSGAATSPRAIMPPAEPLRLAAPPPAQESVPPPPNAAAGAVGDQALETPGAAILPGAAEPAPAAQAGKFAKTFEGKRDGELRQRAKILADTLTRPGTTARRASNLREEAAAIAAELAARKEARRAAGNTGRGFGIAPLPDGTPDLLNAIADAGGVRPPRADDVGGEYDGFAETFRAGMPRLLRNADGQAVDQLIADLNEQGYRFETADDFYRAVTQAVQVRGQARAEFERMMETDKFRAAALENRGRAKGEAAGKPVAVDELRVGDKFKVKREPFEVVDIDADTGDVIVQDGPRFGTQTLPAGTTLHPDGRSLRRVPRGEVDFLPPEEEAAAMAAVAARQPEPAAVSAAPAFDPTQPFDLLPAAPASAPGVRAGENLDLFTGGETGGDTTFNLAGETGTDFSGFMDERATADAARRAAEARQGGLFGGQAFGIAAPGSDAFTRLQRMYDPQSVLPDEMRRALRFGQQAEAAILGRARSIQSDLRRALNQVAKTNPGAADATFAYLTGGQPLTALPPAVRFPAQQARALIDGLSDRAIREGVVTGDLANTFADNLGTYLRRSYRLFADPSYFPEQAVRDRAAAYIMANWDPKRTLTRREADTVIAQLLDRPAASQFMLGGKVAGRDVSSLVRRKDLAPEIRALYGEITDPLEAFGQTVPRLASLIENHHAQQWIRLAGLRMGIFETAPSPLSPRQLVSDSNRPHEVWRGLYTSPEVAEAMQKEARTNPRGLNLQGWLFDTLRTWQGISKVTKTVLSPDSYAPNILGGLVSMAANGNFNILPGGRGLLLAAEDLGVMRAAGVLPQNRVQLQADIEKLSRLGLRGEGLSAADLLQTWERSLLPQMKSRAGRIVRPWLRGYGAIDDTTKYMAWKSELARLRSWQPTAPLERLEREAAERVRATMPTYSEVPKWLREFSQVGFAPSFVSFTYEVFRNTANSARIGYQDLASGIRNGNKAQAADGARRLVALLAVLGLSSGAGIAALSRRENSVTDDQDEAVRFFGPKWNQNGMLMYNRPVEAGKTQYSNISYILPHALVFEALESGARAETGEEAVKRFGNTFMKQFLAGDGGVFLGPVVEAWVGVNRETGRPVINRESPTPFTDSMRYVYDQSLEPGFVAKAQRTVKAIREEKGPFGRVYSLSEEGWRLAGVRAQTIDFNLAAEYKARELGRRWTDATLLYRTMQGRNVPEADLEAAYARSEQARQTVFSVVQNYLRLGRVAGVPDDALVKNLRAAGGLSADELLGALDGRYVAGSREKRESGAALIERVAKLPEEQRASELVRAITADPRLARSLQREVETLAKGITQRDRLVLALNVNDGSRARWIAGQLAEGRVPVAEAGAWLGELRRKGILTDSVRDQLQTGSWQQMGE